jgi:phage I-like protein
MKDLIQAILKEIGPDAPQAFPVLPAGLLEVEGEPSPILVDERAADLVIADFRRRGNDMVIDYEHQTLSGGQAPAAGWIRELRWVPDTGIVASAEWTEKAVAYLKSREYRYFSPVFYFGKSDRRAVSLQSVALTNTPRINHLKPIIAKLNSLNPSKEEKTMFEKIKAILKLTADATEDKAVEAVQLLANKLQGFVACKEVLDAIGAKAEASKEEVVRIVSSLKSSTAVACKEVMDALGAKAESGKDEVVQIIASLKAPGTVAVELSQQVAKLTKELADLKKDDLVQLALKQGQTSPDELAKWGNDLALKNPDQFKLIVLSRPVGSVVPVEGLKLSGDLDKSGLDGAQLSINKLMGIDEETYKKFGPKAA